MEENESDTGEVSPEFLAEGTFIAGRYEIIRLLGTGGMGCVYLARDRILGAEEVAVKVLHRQLAYDEKYTQRFLREVQLMRRVNHESVVRTYDVGADRDLVYFSMEYVPGKSLLDIMEARRYTLDANLEFTMQVCSGLAAIHEANIVHRDLKPENIMFADDATIKIADFGVARPEYSELTAHNEVIGSAAYMAPELWLGEKITSSVDLYSLGVILYEMFTDRLPFEGDTPAILMRQHLDRTPTPPKEINEDIPRWLNRLILRLLEKSPTHRPRSAAEVHEVIETELERNSNRPKRDPATAVDSSFIDKLEATSKRATDRGATSSFKRDTHSFRMKVFPWNRPSKAHFISKLTRPGGGARTIPPTFKQFPARVMRMAMMLAVACAGIIGLGLLENYELTRTLELDQTDFFFQRNATTEAGSIRELVAGNIAPVLMLLCALSLPGMLIGASASATRAVKGFLLFAAYFTVTGIGLFCYHSYPATEAWEWSAMTIANAASATGTHLFELATLQPYVSQFNYVMLDGGLHITPIKALPVTNSVVFGTLSLLYLLFILFACRRALHRIAKKPELVYFLIGGVLIAVNLSMIFNYSLDDYLTGPFISELTLSQYRIKLPFSLHQLSLFLWGFIYFSVLVVVPLVGGTLDER